MQELSERQAAIDATVAEWPDVRAKQVFGYRGYVRSGKMFGFHAGEGLAVKARAGEDTDTLYDREGILAFSYNGMEMRAWPILPLRSDSEAEYALTALQRAYETATAT